MSPSEASSPTAFTIGPVNEHELDELLALVRAYCDFYEVAPSDSALRSLMEGLLASRGREGLQLLARDPAGQPVGFATLVFTWSTTGAGRAAVINDLYVAAHARGRGLAEALIDRCIKESKRHGAVELGWITHPDNRRAQAVYDRIGALSEPWLTYGFELSSAADGGRRAQASVRPSQ